jgi:hypothetical protein
VLQEGASREPRAQITIDGNGFGVKKPGAASPAFDGTDELATNPLDPDVDATQTDVATNRDPPRPAGGADPEPDPEPLEHRIIRIQSDHAASAS